MKNKSILIKIILIVIIFYTISIQFVSAKTISDTTTIPVEGDSWNKYETYVPSNAMEFGYSFHSQGGEAFAYLLITQANFDEYAPYDHGYLYYDESWLNNVPYIVLVTSILGKEENWYSYGGQYPEEFVFIFYYGDSETIYISFSIYYVENHLMLYIIIGAVAVAGVVLSIILVKKKKKYSY